MQRKLSNSQNEGLITLISKPDKDNPNACNYKPITVLNCDYKILSKVNVSVIERMYPLLTKLIKDDQNGLIKSRNIANDIKLMFDVIDYANSKNIFESVLSVFM